MGDHTIKGIRKGGKIGNFGVDLSREESEDNHAKLWFSAASMPNMLPLTLLNE